MGSEQPEVALLLLYLCVSVHECVFMMASGKYSALLDSITLTQTHFESWTRLV